jgi:hypothetical protein
MIDRMQQAAVAMAAVLTLVCLWWTIDYVRRRSRGRRRR